MRYNLNDWIQNMSNAEPVPTHLVWSVWAWIGMVLLFLVVTAVNVVVSVWAGREEHTGLKVAAGFVAFVFALVLHSVMRHVPVQWVVVLMAAILIIGLCAVFFLAECSVLPYFLSLGSIGIPLGLDALARHLSMIPISWAAFGGFLLMAVVVVGLLALDRR